MRVIFIFIANSFYINAQRVNTINSFALDFLTCRIFIRIRVNPHSVSFVSSLIHATKKNSRGNGIVSKLEQTGIEKYLSLQIIVRMEFSALRYSWHAVETRHAVQRLQWLLRRLPKMSRGNTTNPSFLHVFQFDGTEIFPFIFYLYIIDLNYIVRQHLIRLIRQGGSQRTTGNFEKTTLVGRQPSKLPTMDDRSLVHRCSNYPRLTVDLGKFSSPVQFFSFYFERQKSRRTFFFNVILINIEKKKIHRAYFKSIDFGYQDKNWYVKISNIVIILVNASKTDVRLIIRSVCKFFFW